MLKEQCAEDVVLSQIIVQSVKQNFWLYTFPLERRCIQTASFRIYRDVPPTSHLCCYLIISCCLKRWNWNREVYANEILRKGLQRDRKDDKCEVQVDEIFMLQFKYGSLLLTVTAAKNIVTIWNSSCQDNITLERSAPSRIMHATGTIFIYSSDKYISKTFGYLDKIGFSQFIRFENVSPRLSNTFCPVAARLTGDLT